MTPLEGMLAAAVAALFGALAKVVLGYRADLREKDATAASFGTLHAATVARLGREKDAIEREFRDYLSGLAEHAVAAKRERGSSAGIPLDAVDPSAATSEKSRGVSTLLRSLTPEEWAVVRDRMPDPGR